MPKFVGEKVVKKLTKRDGNNIYVENLSSIEVVYTKPFVKVPKLFVNLDGDANFKVVNKTKTGFKLQFRDGSFNSLPYTGELDWEAVPDDAIE